MIKVVSFKICPFVQRITALLEAKGMAYEIEYISLQDKPQWFLDISPNAQVPLLVTESGTALFESDAIAEYIDDIQTPLNKNLSAEQRALERAWIYQATKHYLTQCSTMRSTTAESLIERSNKLNKAFERVEKALGDTTFFNGETVGNVDMAWLPLLHRAAIIENKSCHDFLKNYPKTKAWQKSLLATGLADKSVAEDFTEVFSDFYLSDQTFLGAGPNCNPGAVNPCSSNVCC